MRKAYFLPVVLMAWPYLGPLLFYLFCDAGEVLYSCVFTAYLVLTIVVYLLNIFNAYGFPKDLPARRLAFWNMLLKLVHIPFYLAVFAIGMVFLLAMVVPALLFVSPPLLLTLVAIDLFLMLTSSAYGISALLRARRAGQLSTGAALLHGLLHLIFVADVISAVLVYRRLRRLPAPAGPDVPDAPGSPEYAEPAYAGDAASEAAAETEPEAEP